MKTIYTADCETDPFEHNTIPAPFIWGIYTGEDFKYFYDLKDFINHLHTLKRCIVYFHNGGKFDFHFLVDHIKKGSKVKIINGRLVTLQINEVELRDSYAILPIALSKYNKETFDYNKLKKSNRDKHKVEIISYLKSDCVNLHTLVSKFIKNYGDNLTIASSAMSYFKGMGNIVKHSSEAFYDKFVPYFKGGMVTCIRGGSFYGDIKYIDINSAYPNAMTHNHPTGFLYVQHTKNSWEPQDFIVFEGNVLQAHPSLFTSVDNTISITGWELNVAIKHNLVEVRKIIKVTHFVQYIEFNEYVNIFYNKKLNAKLSGDKEEYNYAKLFLNSLYGKFAQNPKKFKNYKVIQPIDFEKYPDYQTEAHMTELSSIISKNAVGGRFYNVATAASITGFVRAQLTDAIYNVETPIYCDTDSLFYMGESNIKTGLKLGEWELEGTFSELHIAGKKLYAAKGEKEWKTATKGARLTPSEIIKIVNNEKVLYKSEAPIFSLKKGIYFQNKIISNTVNR